MDLFLARAESKANGVDEPSRGCNDLALKVNAVFVEPVIPGWLFDIWQPLCTDMSSLANGGSLGD